jgi:hypothetical protein
MGNGLSRAPEAEKERYSEQERASNNVVHWIASNELSLAVLDDDDAKAFELLKSERADAIATFPPTHVEGDSWYKRVAIGSSHDNNPLIFYAIRNKSERMAHLLIGRGCENTLSAFFKATTPAMRDDSVDLQKDLFKTSSPNAKFYITMADVAAFVGDKALMDRLLNYEATVVSPSTLAFAAYGGHTAVILSLKDKFSGVDTLYALREWPATPLGIAAGRGHLATTNALLRLGANVNFSIYEKEGNDTALFNAVIGVHKWFKYDEYEAGILGRLGPDSGGPCAPFLRMAELVKPDVKGKAPQAPLPSRAMTRRIIRTLIAAGANVNAMVNYQGETKSLLMWAVTFCIYPAILELVLAEAEEARDPKTLKELEKVEAKGGQVYEYSPDNPEDIASLRDPEDDIDSTTLSPLAEGEGEERVECKVARLDQQARKLYDHAARQIKQQQQREEAKRAAQTAGAGAAAALPATVSAGSGASHTAS